MPTNSQNGVRKTHRNTGDGSLCLLLDYQHGEPSPVLKSVVPMLKKSIFLILAILIILSNLAACSKNDGSDMDLIYPITAEPVSLDPQIAKDKAEKIIVNKVICRSYHKKYQREKYFPVLAGFKKGITNKYYVC